MASDNISFFINGEEHMVSNDIHPATRLSDYLRQVARLKGTKVMCREGGCGACVVSVENIDPVTQRSTIRAINSCLCPITIARGWHITTTEGLGSQQNGFHPIQQRMADYSATQCGYCTPGFVMSAFSLLKEHPESSTDDLHNALDGNLCRCTGYRSIADAMKSLTQDKGDRALDIEDLTKLKCCSKKSRFTNPGSALIQRPPSHLTWQRPQSLNELISLLHANSDRKTRLVFGNTATGIYKKDYYELYYDIHDVKELYTVQADGTGVELGANLTLTALQGILTEYSKKEGLTYLSYLADFFNKVANKPVRNAGCWAGNLMIQHDHPEFPSDIYTPFTALGATVTIADKSGVKQITTSELMSENMQGKVILSIKLPVLGNHQTFQVYKVMPRNKGTHCYVNAAFLLTFSTDEKKIIQASVVFNGLGPNNHIVDSVQNYLVGKSPKDLHTMTGCLQILDSSLKVTDHGDSLVSAEYRKSLARNLLFKFLSQFVVNGLEVPPATLHRPMNSGRQNFKTQPENYPITQPIPKLSGKIQASGETVYVDDMPRLEGELYAVLVLSTIGVGEIDTIDTQQALTKGGAVNVVTANDIKGKNFMDKINLLAEKNIEYNAQPIAIVLADTASIAYKAASLVKITYKNVQKPVLEIDEAITKDRILEVYPTHSVGDTKGAFKSCTKIIEGVFRHGFQYQFYIENQACLCTPTECGFDLWSSSQFPDFVQGTVAAALDVPTNCVHITVPRVGGGFGGKTTFSGFVAALTAVASQKTNRSVRLALGLETCMKMTGHRPDIKITYKMGLDENNVIQAIENDVYWNVGHRNDESSLIHANILVQTAADGAYYVPNRSVTTHMVKTDKQLTTAMRAPGNLPGNLLAEHMMEHAAWVVQEPLDSFKQRHLYRQGQMMLLKRPYIDNNLIELWKTAVSSSEYDSRLLQVNEFNKTHKWVKRGLAIGVSKFPINYTPMFSYPVYMAVYHHDGSVIISHGGAEIGQGLHTKVTQVAGKELGIPLELIKTHAVNTLTAPNSTVTGGSQTSEYVCRTTAECCKLILEKLAPVKQKNPDADWKTLVNKAYETGINMAVTHRMPQVSDEEVNHRYTTSAVIVAEAEVDILTGESNILRADVHMDIGQSVNPEIDIGQIEGGLVMGLGMMLHEREVYSQDTGELLTSSTWEYHPPTIADIPVDFRISLLKDKPNKRGIYSSKAIGEPPLCASPAFLFAVKAAIRASLVERGHSQYFPMYAPATPEEIVKACKVSMDDLIC